MRGIREAGLLIDAPIAPHFCEFSHMFLPNRDGLPRPVINPLDPIANKAAGPVQEWVTLGNCYSMSILSRAESNHRFPFLAANVF